MDYLSLKDTLTARLNRSDLAIYYDEFIDRAAEVINARLAQDPVRPMAATRTYTTSAQTLNLDEDIIELVDVRASDGSDTWRLVRLEPEDNADFYADKALPYAVEPNASRIQHYVTFGNSIALSAAPASTLTITVKCFVKVSALSDATPSNWLIDKHAIVYVLGALAYAYGHMRDPDEDNMTQRFLAALEQVVVAYPERFNPTELRAADAPWANRRWSILNG